MPASVVIDPSVFAAVVFEEPEASNAMALIGGAEMHAPVLLAYELASVARKKARLYPDQREGIIELMKMALAMDIRWAEVAQEDVVRLSLEAGLSTYDASYLLLARTLRIPLATFDGQLRAASQTPYI